MARSFGDSTTRAANGASSYRVLGPLAAGGMAQLELALQESPGGFQRLVALKRVKPELSDSDFEAMFLEESRIAARLNHPNLIHAYEVGQDQSGLFLAMEYLSGQTLAQVIEVAGYEALDLRFTLQVLINALSGLEYVHQLADIAGRPMGLVHRDVSPSNIFITYSGQVKVLDFGIAKANESSVRTQTGVLKGKVSYMAPEQAMAGAVVDARADLYALGVMLWEAVAARRRWGELQDVPILRELTAGTDAPAPGGIERGYPALADSICGRALAFEPDQRFQNAAEFRSALEALEGELGPRYTAGSLCDALVPLFAADRAEERRLLDAQLEGAQSPRSGQDLANADGTRKVALKRGPSAPPPAAQALESVLRPASVKAARTSPSGFAGLGWRALAVGTALAGAGYFAVLFSHTLHRAPPPAIAPSVKRPATQEAPRAMQSGPEVTPVSSAPLVPSAALRANASKRIRPAERGGNPASAAQLPTAASASLRVDRGDPWSN